MRLKRTLTTFKARGDRFGGLWSGRGFPPPSRPGFCTNRAGALRGSGAFVHRTLTAPDWQSWAG
jgi:hypothetical protein